MSNFWKEYKGGLIISIISVLLGACVQVGLMYIKPQVRPQTPQAQSQITTQPQTTAPIIIEKRDVWHDDYHKKTRH